MSNKYYLLKEICIIKSSIFLGLNIYKFIILIISKMLLNSII